MRVLETETTPSYNMGKNRKHKLRKATKEASESSDDGAPTVQVCTHINLAVNLAAMRKGLAKQTFGECASCSLSSRRPDTPSEQACAAQIEDHNVNLLGDGDITFWVCLQCGNQGCDRNSREKHALKHYETPRSSCHCLAVNTSSWTCWCYKCDDEVPVEQKRLQECIEYLRKQIPQTDAGKRTSQGAIAAVGSDQVPRDVNTRPLTSRGSSAVFCHKIKGLSNLGNTCFFNAVLQNLTQTQCLESLLVERLKKGKGLTIPCKHYSDSDDSSGDESDGESQSCKDLPTIEINLGEVGLLSQSLLNFLQEMNNNSTSRSSTVNPNALFNLVCKKAQRFRGFQQQDSHELLRYLLDSMKTEEIKRRQAGILKHFKLSENVNPKKVDEETKQKVKVYGKQVRQTFVDNVFGGHLISTIICEECKFISQIFEPFLDLSLPVTEEKPQRPNQMLGGRKKEEAETPEEQSTFVGVEGFAYNPSKHASRKQKRQAKKESKRKNKVAKNKVSPLSEAGEEEDVPEDEEPQKEESIEGGETGDTKEEQKDQGEEDSSNRDDPSDADIEDNLESDTSKILKYTPVSENEDLHNTKSDISTPVLPKEKEYTETIDVKTNNDLNEETDKNLLQNTENHKNSELDEQSLLASGTGGTELSGSSSTTCKGSTESETSMSGSTMKNGDIASLHSGLENSVTEISNQENDCTCTSHSTSQVNHLNGDCVENGKTDEQLSSDIEGVRKSLSDTRLAERNHINSNSLPQCSNSCKNNCLNSDLLCEKVQKLKLTHDQDNGEYDLSNQTSTDCTPLLKSKSADSITSDNGRNSPKLVSCGSIKRSCPPLIRQSSKANSKSKKELCKEAQVKSTVTLGPRYHPSSRECTIMSCLHQFTSAELLTGNNKFGCVNCSRIKNKQNPNKEKKETVYSNASKQYLIFVPPAVLTLHMKRFEQVGFSSRKVNRHVDFPFVLDLAPYCSSLCQGIKPGQKRVLYALYGVVEHSGRLNTGHYTAYVKVRPNIGLGSSFLPSDGPSRREYIQRYSENIANGIPLENEESDEVMEEKLVPPGRWYHISDSRVSEVTDSAVQRAQAYLLFYERIY